MAEQHVVETIFVTAKNPQSYTYVINGDMQNTYTARNYQMYSFLCGYAPPHLFKAISDCLDTSTSFVLDVSNSVLYSFRLIGTENPQKVHLRLWGANPLGAAIQERRVEEQQQNSAGFENSIRWAVGNNVMVMGNMYSIEKKWT